MHIVLRCPCGANLKADMKFVGKEMKCPKCNTKLIVPEPPTAATAEPQLLELADFDPLQIPMAQPLPGQQPPRQVSPGKVLPGQVPPGQVHSGLAQARAVGPQSAGQSFTYGSGAAAGAGFAGKGLAKPKPGSAGLSRIQFWAIAGGVIGLVVLCLGGYLLWEYSRQRSSLARDMNFVVENGKRVDLEALKQNTTQVQPPEPPPPPKDNAYDRGEKVLRDDSIASASDNLEMSELIDRVEPSIVRLKVENENEESIGSGFFIDREGKILTNYHVIQGAAEVTVSTADGKQTKALGWIIVQPDRDLAILQIDPQSLQVVPIAIAQSMPRRGEEVAAFGAPEGFSFSATKGIISAIRTGSDVKNILEEMNNFDVYSALGYTPEMNWIQSSAAISSGNSGGPLVNLRGEFVGVNTWTHRGGQNLNFASTLDEANQIFAARTNKLHPFKGLPPTRVGR